MRRPFVLAIPIIAIAALAAGIVPASASSAITHQAVPRHAIAILRPAVPRHAIAILHQPSDIVICDVTPDEPYQFGRGAPIFADAHIVCEPHAMDICNVTVILWRYDSHRNQYYEQDHTTSNYCGTDWHVNLKFTCHYAVGWWFHTEVKAAFFHGNWADVDGNSPPVFLYC